MSAANPLFRVHADAAVGPELIVDSFAGGGGASARRDFGRARCGELRRPRGGAGGGRVNSSIASMWSGKIVRRWIDCIPPRPVCSSMIYIHYLKSSTKNMSVYCVAPVFCSIGMRIDEIQRAIEKEVKSIFRGIGIRKSRRLFQQADELMQSINEHSAKVVSGGVDWIKHDYGSKVIDICIYLSSVSVYYSWVCRAQNIAVRHFSEGICKNFGADQPGCDFFCIRVQCLSCDYLGLTAHFIYLTAHSVQAFLRGEPSKRAGSNRRRRTDDAADQAAPRGRPSRHRFSSHRSENGSPCKSAKNKAAESQRRSASITLHALRLLGALGVVEGYFAKLTGALIGAVDEASDATARLIERNQRGGDHA